METIQCKVKLLELNSQSIAILPLKASEQLPSRGMCMAECAINGKSFTVALEPDGKRSHWFYFTEKMRQLAGNKDELSIKLEVVTDWSEPELPFDLKNALKADKEAMELWKSCTAKAHWDWIRWIQSTKNPSTRTIRIEKAISKLKSGLKNPCCFNRSVCSVTEVSKNGILLSED